LQVQKKSLPLQPQLRENGAERHNLNKIAKFLKKVAKKVWKIKNLALPLQSVRVTKVTNGFKLVL